MSQLAAFSEITKYQAHVCSPRRMAEFTNRCSPMWEIVPYLQELETKVREDCEEGDLVGAFSVITNLRMDLCFKL